MSYDGRVHSVRPLQTMVKVPPNLTAVEYQTLLSELDELLPFYPGVRYVCVSECPRNGTHAPECSLVLPGRNALQRTKAGETYW